MGKELFIKNPRSLQLFIIIFLLIITKKSVSYTKLEQISELCLKLTASQEALVKQSNAAIAIRYKSHVTMTGQVAETLYVIQTNAPFKHDNCSFKSGVRWKIEKCPIILQGSVGGRSVLKYYYNLRNCCLNTFKYCIGWCDPYI